MGKSILEETELEVRVETLSRRNAELEAALKKETARADSANAGMTLAIAAARAGVKPNAIGDAVYRAMGSGQWKAKNGTLIRHTADGLPEMDVTPEKAIEALRIQADHLWPDDTQGDYRAPQQAPAAPQERKPVVHEGQNPWVKGKSWNFTKQTDIRDSDPARADALEKEAEKINLASHQVSRTGIPASRYGIPASRYRG